MGIVVRGGPVRAGDMIGIDLPPPPHAPLVDRAAGAAAFTDAAK